MAKILPASKDGWYKFKCPGCGNTHYISTKELNGSGAQWKFNGDMDKPTFNPSINEKTGKYVDHSINDSEIIDMSYICHFVITDGNIFFAADSTHEKAGQTIELPEIV